MADLNRLIDVIDTAWEVRAALPDSDSVKAAVDEAITLMDQGIVRVCEKQGNGDWVVNQWLKKAVLLSFRLTPNGVMHGGPSVDAGKGRYWDKVPSKFETWEAADFEKAGFRAVPPAAARRGSFIAAGAILMPSYVNIGAYVDAGTMVDTWATVGSCAQIGKNCHISGGAGIGGVLEPLQANPVIIEDNCFIGARSEVAEGVIVREGAVLSMGVYLGASTKIIDRETGETFMGEVPPYAVVVPGTVPPRKNLPGQDWGPSLYCAVIVKRVDEQTRAKTSVNELLRD